MTELVTIRNLADAESDLLRAADLLRSGGLVVFPTETVYGLGGDARCDASAKKIYAAKGRPSDNPLIIHVAAPEDAEPYAVTCDLYYRLAKAFLPGPLTIILPKKDTIPLSTTGGLDSVAVRCPSHPVAHRLLELCGFPVAAPSANRSGSPSPTCAAHVLADLDGKVDMILDGGDCEIGLESTIVKIDDEHLTLLRPGAITPDALSLVCPDVRIADAVLGQLKEGEKVLSPGMKYKHYAPSSPLVLLDGAPERVLAFLQEEQAKGECAILCYDEETSLLKQQNLFPVGAKDDLAAHGKILFHALREADATGVRVIYAHLPPKEGLGLALYNRMIRAAAHTVRNII